ncbi:MAG: class I SAM-dependent methyltransferase [Rhodocyclaceae bacterium]|nr:class I SAM-dependent methyltransferase [Rhodocyclaceae bacterium]
MNDDKPMHDADYRDSHLHRGKSYDGNLATDPFDAYMADMERIYLQEIISDLFANGVPRYRDFACGTGRITQTVSPHAKKTIGVDISPSMLEQAGKKCPDVDFMHADLTTERRDIGQFDLVTSFRFFGNAQPALRNSVLLVLSSLVRPGGYLIANNHRNPHSLAALLHLATGGNREMDLTYFLFKGFLPNMASASSNQARSAHICTGHG